MTGAVLLVGDELLGGVVSDRNVAPIARALGPRGVALLSVETVGDDEERIAAAARRLAGEHGLLVVCGGLGPTEDDRTRHALARALGVELRVKESIRAEIEARLAARGLPAEGAARQASFPEGTVPVPNPVGSAPGFRGDLAGCGLWALPGVPDEAWEMVEILAGSLPAPAAGRAWERIVATVGLGEVRVAGRLADAGFEPPPGVSLGYLPAPGGVRLRLSSAEGVPGATLDRAEARLHDLFGPSALPAATIVESLVRVLAERGETIATAESCTGGLLGARITDVPGASSVYLGGVVPYSNAAKTRQLGVDAGLIRADGAVSELVAVAMADGCRRTLGAGLAVSVTGIAGPAGGAPDKPVGTVWIGMADGARAWAESFRFGGTRNMVRERTVNKALEIAYRQVVGSAA